MWLNLCLNYYFFNKQALKQDLRKEKYYRTVILYLGGKKTP